MDDEQLFNSAYKGTKNFTQHNVVTANATGFGAATDRMSFRMRSNYAAQFARLMKPFAISFMKS